MGSGLSLPRYERRVSYVQWSLGATKIVAKIATVMDDMPALRRVRSLHAKYVARGIQPPIMIP